MPYRELPKSVIGRNKVMEKTTEKVNSTAPEDCAISAETKGVLEILFPKFRSEVAERHEQFAKQADASTEENKQQSFLYCFVSHFIRVFFLGIERGKYKASDLLYYGLNANQNDLPKLRTEQDLVSWANNLIAGEEKRMTVDEGEKKAKPMTNPSISEVQGALDTYVELRKAQSAEKQAFDAENKDVLNMLPEIDDLIREIYDEVEFYYRKETAANKRKLAREWGVVYVSSPDEEPEEEEEDEDED